MCERKPVTPVLGGCSQRLRAEVQDSATLGNVEPWQVTKSGLWVHGSRVVLFALRREFALRGRVHGV